MQDFRFAVRQLLKTPGFTVVAVLTLALAIGVNSAIFALINGVLLKPVVPVKPAEVVNVFTARQNASHDYRQFSHNEYRELRENGGDVFVDVAALEFAVGGTLTGRGADLIVIDDPLKAEEAMSETSRKRAIDWYSGTLVSRLNDKEHGPIIVVMQRLHENDLAGHLLEQGGWEHLISQQQHLKTLLCL